MSKSTYYKTRGPELRTPQAAEHGCGYLYPQNRVEERWIPVVTGQSYEKLHLRFAGYPVSKITVESNRGHYLISSFGFVCFMLC